MPRSRVARTWPDAPGSRYINGDPRFAEVGLEGSVGRPLRCIKFMVLWAEGAAATYENLIYRTFLLPQQGSLKLDHDWNQD